MKRHHALISAFEDASLELPRLNWAIPTSYSDRDATHAPSFQHALLAFLRGPPLHIADGRANGIASYDAKRLESIIAHGALSPKASTTKPR